MPAGSTLTRGAKAVVELPSRGPERCRRGIPDWAGQGVERVTGIEPAFSAWEPAGLDSARGAVKVGVEPEPEGSFRGAYREGLA